MEKGFAFDFAYSYSLHSPAVLTPDHLTPIYFSGERVDDLAYMYKYARWKSFIINF